MQKLPLEPKQQQPRRRRKPQPLPMHARLQAHRLACHTRKRTVQRHQATPSAQGCQMAQMATPGTIIAREGGA